MDHYHEKIRGYSRPGEIDDAVCPSFPVYRTWTKIKCDENEDDDVIDADESPSRKQSMMSDISDYGLVRLFAPIQPWTPSNEAKLLASGRRNNLLYSRMYYWHPTPVTYENFFLPQIHRK